MKSAGITTVGVRGFVSPYTEGADAESYPWFDGCYCVVDLLDEQVDVVPSPVASVHPFSKFPVAFVVGEGGALYGVGVEVVVEVYGVDVVSSDDVGDDAGDEVAILLQCGVEVDFSTIFDEPFRVLVVDVSFRESLFCRSGDSVWVEPGVEFHATSVSFGDDKTERIPSRVRGTSCGTCQMPAPRLDLRRVEGVGLRSDLEDDGVAPGAFEFVELGADIFFVLSRCLARPLLLVDGAHPSAAEFALSVGTDIGGGLRSGGECESNYRGY